jgi:hypothetical protein
VTKWCYTTYTIPAVRVPCPVLIFISSDFLLFHRHDLSAFSMSAPTFHSTRGPTRNIIQQQEMGSHEETANDLPSPYIIIIGASLCGKIDAGPGPAADRRRRASPACLSIGQRKAGVSRSMLDGLAGLYSCSIAASQIKSNQNIADIHTQPIVVYIY